MHEAQRSRAVTPDTEDAWKCPSNKPRVAFVVISLGAVYQSRSTAHEAITDLTKESRGTCIIGRNHKGNNELT